MSASQDEGGPTRNETEHSAPEITAPATLDRIDDRLARALGIPGFGIAIPNLTGLLGDLSLRNPITWVGYLGFIGLAAMLWEGNRAILLAQRRHWDWFQHPIQKVTFMLAANVFYTAPLSAGCIWAWYQLAPLALDLNVLVTVVLSNTICVVIVTHGYETAFLIRERSVDHLRAERLQRAKVEAELAALRAQLDPHFMFNALNTLAYLVERRPKRAVEFSQHLADVYRYVLAQRDNDLVLLSEELEFLRSYAFLIRLRFDDALQVHVEDPHQLSNKLLVPSAALQLLLENVSKHNRLDADEPLVVVVSVGHDHVRVSNPRRPREAPMSSKLGLQNLGERSLLTTGRDMAIVADEARFEVWLPALGLSA